VSITDRGQVLTGMLHVENISILALNEFWVLFANGYKLLVISCGIEFMNNYKGQQRIHECKIECLSCILFIQATLLLVMEILLADENGYLDLRQEIGRLINAIVAVLGPELSPGSTFFSRCKVSKTIILKTCFK
jgi:hypothetical protein